MEKLARGCEIEKPIGFVSVIDSELAGSRKDLSFLFYVRETFDKIPCTF